jgi:hypothetical protein
MQRDEMQLHPYIVPLPPVVFGVGFDPVTGEPQAMYCGQDFSQCKADISWAVANGEVSLGYIFRAPEPTAIFRPDPAATRAATPGNQPAEPAPASPS